MLSLWPLGRDCPKSGWNPFRWNSHHFSRVSILEALHLIYTPGFRFYRSQVCLSHRKREKDIHFPRKGFCGLCACSTRQGFFSIEAKCAYPTGKGYPLSQCQGVWFYRPHTWCTPWCRFCTKRLQYPWAHCGFWFYRLHTWCALQGFDPIEANFADITILTCLHSM